MFKFGTSLRLPVHPGTGDPAKRGTSPKSLFKRLI